MKGLQIFFFGALIGAFTYHHLLANTTPVAAEVAGTTSSSITILLEGEDGSGDGKIMPRSNASNQKTVWLHAGESRLLSFQLAASACYMLSVRYSNDGGSDQVEVSMDGVSVGQFTTQHTRPSGGQPGSGWNNFFSIGPIGSVDLPPGPYNITVSVTQADFYGVEIDVVTLESCPVTSFDNCQMCFRWQADGDAGQCNSVPFDGTTAGNGTTCAPIDTWTPRYRDDTDGRNGGCRMSWKIDCTPPFGD